MNDIDSAFLDAPVFKRIDDPWIGLLILGIGILISSIIAICALYFFWRRYRRLTQIYNEHYILSNKPTGKRQIPMQFEEQQPKPYETRKMEGFVPQNNNERIPGRFPPPDDIQRVHQFYERTTQAYF